MFDNKILRPCCSRKFAPRVLLLLVMHYFFTQHMSCVHGPNTAWHAGHFIFCRPSLVSHGRQSYTQWKNAVTSEWHKLVKENLVSLLQDAGAFFQIIKCPSSTKIPYSSKCQQFDGNEWIWTLSSTYRFLQAGTVSQVPGNASVAHGISTWTLGTIGHHLEWGWQRTSGTTSMSLPLWAQCYQIHCVHDSNSSSLTLCERKLQMDWMVCLNRTTHNFVGPPVPNVPIFPSCAGQLLP